MKGIFRKFLRIKDSLKVLFQFKFHPTKDTGIAFLLGSSVVAASLGLFLFPGDTTISKNCLKE